MRVFITGGTGFVGKSLTKHLLEKGHQLTILTRRKISSHEESIRYLEGDPVLPGPWQEEAAEADAIINLAGASIFSRWNKKTKEQILKSRVLTTRNLAKTASSSTIFLSASAVGYYGFTGDEELDESSPAGKDFLAKVCSSWEEEAFSAQEKGARAAVCRFGIVLGPDGGALNQMTNIFKLGIGGRLGNGKQWFSWIHINDLVRAFSFCLENKEAEGPINFCAPKAVTNRELTKALGNALKRPAILPVPGFMMRLVMGEFGSVLLKGQRVIPARLNELGFTFEFPEINKALTDIL